MVDIHQNNRTVGKLDPDSVIVRNIGVSGTFIYRADVLGYGTVTADLKQEMLCHHVCLAVNHKMDISYHNVLFDI